VPSDDGPGRQRVEVIHESLLRAWPRLVRWQAQDAEGALLRDQLRQAAAAWDERGRSDDLLWSGAAYREYLVWRERYPGGLTNTEEAFASAMTSLATRRRRRRRMAVAAAVAIFLVGLAVVSSFWRRSVLETRRAEAQKLIALAQVELESYPSAAVAYATASLELSDSHEARLLAVRALWRGPTALVVNEEPSYDVAFTPNGDWLVQATDTRPVRLHVIGAHGSDVRLEDVQFGGVAVRMSPDSGVFATLPWDCAEPYALWSAPDRRLLAKANHELCPDSFLGMYDDLKRRRVLFVWTEGDRTVVSALGFDDTSERLGTLPFDLSSAARSRNAPNGRWFAVSDGRHVYVIDVGDHGLSEPRRLEHLAGSVTHVECDPLGRLIAARYEDGQIRLLDLAGASPPRVIKGPSGITALRITSDGSLLWASKSNRENLEVEMWMWSLDDTGPTLLRHVDLGRAGGVGPWTINPVKRQIVSIINPDAKTRLWPLRAPADAAPVIMQRGDVGALRRLAIHPDGGWLATSGTKGLTLWPQNRAYPMVINRYGERIGNLVFGPEGLWLATSTLDSSGTVRLWQLEGDNLPAARVVYEAGTHAYGIAASPDGKSILLGSHTDTVKLLLLSGDAPIDLPGHLFAPYGVAISADGRFAAAYGLGEDNTNVIRVWDLTSHEEVDVIDGDDTEAAIFLRFTADGHLLSSDSAGLVSWDLETGDRNTLFEPRVERFEVSSDGIRVLLSQVGSKRSHISTLGRAVVLDVANGSTTALTSHGDRVTAVAMDAEGSIAVTGDEDGVVRVGPITGEEPHLLLGNADDVLALAVDPRGRWIASSSGTEVRLWPMPDLSKPPLHTLPRSELIAKLKTLTNLRVVRDEESATGWKLTHDPFPGWETVPSW
jgi:WD40 repeat protein